ncbi:carbohydrate-binding module family 18 protein [Hypoxylon sp. EC38]|nr:carbohydrate-binding module family 18 protein [Hypoxylon sp. EC38]
MFGPKTALAIILLAATAVWSEVSPDQTCGVAKAGNNKGYTCPIEIKCCGGSGYCGASDAHCLTTVGCQDKYSNVTGSCTKPIDGVSISPDGTCGFAGVGKHGYKCPSEHSQCCSVAYVISSLTFSPLCLLVSRVEESQSIC